MGARFVQLGITIEGIDENRQRFKGIMIFDFHAGDLSRSREKPRGGQGQRKSFGHIS
ncbi:MAG TPA: hypothetical protein VIR56_04970 [Solimonas sp.]